MAMDLGATKGRKGGARPEMNVTPLVDVVLVLLIIFMVITPLLAKQFWVHLPDNKTENEPPPPSDADPPVVVTVDKAGMIHINKDAVWDKEFPNKLRRVLAAKGERTIFFDADEKAPFWRAMQALDLARGAGATTIAVMTEALVQR